MSGYMGLIPFSNSESTILLRQALWDSGDNNLESATHLGELDFICISQLWPRPDLPLQSLGEKPVEGSILCAPSPYTQSVILSLQLGEK